jgi:hypothetical protein
MIIITVIFLIVLLDIRIVAMCLELRPLIDRVRSSVRTLPARKWRDLPKDYG